MKKKTIRLCRLGCLLLVFQQFTTVVSAQTDAHYWTHQYGSKGLLLNGAVIASTDDETAVFYNPAALNNIEDDFGLSLSFLSPTYAVLNTTNFLGEGSSIKDDGLDFTPGMAVIGFNPFNNYRLRAAITSFTRFKSNINFRDRQVNQLDNFENSLFVGNLEFSRELSESWFGFGLSVELTDFLSVGASQFLTFHDQSVDFSVQKELVNRNQPNELELGWRNRLKYDFGVYGGMITKFGVSLDLAKIKVGVTLTTPTYYYFSGSASYDYDDLKNYGQDSTILVSNLSDAPVLEYKTPLSIGLGLDFPFKKSRISFSMEYFASIPTYTIFEKSDDPFDGLSSRIIEQNVSANSGNTGVLNVAVGCQTPLSEKSTLIWGFRTDFNQRRDFNNAESIQFLSTTPNVFHLTIGDVFEVWNSRFSFGLDYGFGLKSGNSQLVNFSDVTPQNIFDLTKDGDVSSNYHSLIVILAYDFSFRSKDDN